MKTFLVVDKVPADKFAKNNILSLGDIVCDSEVVKCLKY